jgi:hypothetical protein
MLRLEVGKLLYIEFCFFIFRKRGEMIYMCVWLWDKRWFVVVFFFPLYLKKIWGLMVVLEKNIHLYKYCQGICLLP